MKNIKRILSMVLILILYVSVLPMGIAAKEPYVIEIIPASDKYSYAGKFSYGLSVVQIAESEMPGQIGNYGCLNKDGETTIPFYYTYINDFHNGKAIISNMAAGSYTSAVITPDNKHILHSLGFSLEELDGYYKVVSYSLKCGLFAIDEEAINGENLLGYVNQCFYDDITGYSEDLACVVSKGEDGDKYGFADKSGLVIDYEYDYAQRFTEGMARVCKDGKWGYINKENQPVIEIAYEYLGNLCNGLISVCIDGKWGYVDAVGNTVIEPVYDAAADFSEELAVVSKSGKYGYIDIKGNTVIPYKYEAADNFTDSIARVKQDGKWGYINTDGEFIIPAVYDELGVFSDETAYEDEVSCGFGLARAVIDGKEGLIDKNGNIVVPIEYEYVQSNIDSDIALVKKDGKYGIVNRGGEIRLPIIYDSIPHDNYAAENELFSDGITWVEKDGQWSLIELTDEWAYTVSFVSWDGEIIKEETVKEGDAAKAPPNPIRRRYSFVGWDKEFDNITEDITVKPIYRWATNPFDDVDAESWYYEPIGYVYTSGYMTGTAAPTNPSRPELR